MNFKVYFGRQYSQLNSPTDFRMEKFSAENEEEAKLKFQEKYSNQNLNLIIERVLPDISLENAKKYLDSNIGEFTQQLGQYAYSEVLSVFSSPYENDKFLEFIRGGIFLGEVGTYTSTRDGNTVVKKIREWMSTWDNASMFNSLLTVFENNDYSDYIKPLLSAVLHKHSSRGGEKWFDVDYELVRIQKPSFLHSLVGTNCQVTLKIKPMPQFIVDFLAAFSMKPDLSNDKIVYKKSVCLKTSEVYNDMQTTEMFDEFTFEASSVNKNDIDNQVNRLIAHQDSMIGRVTDTLSIKAHLVK